MLDALPEELILHIFQLLDYKDNVRLSTMCKKIRCVSEDNRLWFGYAKKLYSRLNLPVPSIAEQGMHWKSRMIMLSSGYLDLVLDSNGGGWYCQLTSTDDKQDANIAMSLGPFGIPEQGLLATSLFLDNIQAFVNHSLSSTNIIGVMVAHSKSFGINNTWGKNRTDQVLSQTRKFIGEVFRTESIYHVQLKEFLDDQRIGYRMLLSPEPREPHNKENKRKSQQEPDRKQEVMAYHHHIPKRRRLSHYDCLKMSSSIRVE